MPVRCGGEMPEICSSIAREKRLACGLEGMSGLSNKLSRGDRFSSLLQVREGLFHQARAEVRTGGIEDGDDH